MTHSNFLRLRRFRLLLTRTYAYAHRMTSTSTESRPVFLTTEEVCERLRIGRTKLFELRREEDFPKPARIGHRSLRWREDEIDAWFEASRQSAPSP